jgi:predicted deacylase
MKQPPRSKPLKIGGVALRPGQRRRLEIPVARLPTGSALSLPVTALRGTYAGPTVWLSGAIHGDEIQGTEIIRRVLKRVTAKTLHGALITVPIVNVYGFIERSRYLPDRRDLNRSFPGTRGGSLASRLAHLFLEEVVSKCSHGIDFHTGARHRTNLPHIRAALSDPEARVLAEAFAAPLMFESPLIKGSLRAEAKRRGIPILVFEGGQPLDFSDSVIESGVAGTLRVLAALDMIEPAAAPPPSRPSDEAKTTHWLRAARSGILHLETSLGAEVAKGDVLAWISDPFSPRQRLITAPFSGVVFAQTTVPMVYQGDAVLRLAQVRRSRTGEPTGGETPAGTPEMEKRKGKKPGKKPSKKPSKKPGNKPRKKPGEKPSKKPSKKPRRR